MTTSPTALSLLLLVFLPIVSHGAFGRDECSVVDGVVERLVSPTSVTIAWSYHCPEEKISRFKFYVNHLEYSACNDKTKKARKLIPQEIKNASAREVIIHICTLQEYCITHWIFSIQ